MKKPESAEKNKRAMAAGEEIEKLRSLYEAELKRKDAIIESLRNEREILIKTALKQAQSAADAQRSLEKAHNKTSI